VRGQETLDMLQAMNTGHEGSLVTVHANSPRHAIMRLETLASMTDLNLTFAARRHQTTGAGEVVAHLDRYADGSRKVAEIALTISQHWEPIKLVTVAGFALDHTDRDQTVSGRFVHHGLPAATRRRLERVAAEIPDEFDDELDTHEQVTVVEDMPL
jgi:pilus assembly protein CpaF